MSSNEDLVLVEDWSPYVTLLTLNRPEKRNALNLALMKEFGRKMRALESDKQKNRVVVIKGAGPSFCSGFDLKDALNQELAHVSAQAVKNTLLCISESPFVTIAAVHGKALAAGAGLMSACDLAVASEEASVGYPETGKGLVAALMVTFLRRQLGDKHVRELLLLADPISSADAFRLGMLNRVVPLEDLDKEALSMANSVVKAAPQATLNSKRFLESQYPMSVRQELEIAFKSHLQGRTSHEAEEGFLAFVEKREPHWS